MKHQWGSTSLLSYNTEWDKLLTITPQEGAWHSFYNGWKEDTWKHSNKKQIIHADKDEDKCFKFIEWEIGLF